MTPTRKLLSVFFLYFVLLVGQFLGRPKLLTSGIIKEYKIEKKLAKTMPNKAGTKVIGSPPVSLM